MLNTSTGGLATLEKKLTGNVPDDSMIPRTVLRGARYMLLGGILTAVVGLFLIIATIIDKNALVGSDGNRVSTGQFASGVVETAITYVVLVAIWVLMARMNRAGYAWARILASIFAAISTYDTYYLVNSLTKDQTITVVGIVYIVGTLIIWALGVLSIAFLWRAESSTYIRSRSAAR
jgi:hypothetical protein